MKTMVLLMALTCSFFLTTAQTLQTVTDNGSSTTNTLNALNPNGYQVTGSVGNPAYMVIDQTANSGGKRWRFGHTGAAPGFGSFDLLNITDGIVPLSITSGGNVGIGTTTPQGNLDIFTVNNTANIPLLSIRANFHVPGNYGMIKFGDYTQTTDYQKGAIIYESVAGSARGKFHIALENSDGAGSVSLTDARLTVLSNGNVGVGITSPTDKLAVNGKIRAHEIKVEIANWPDYVFAKSYQLPTLLETEKHIKEKGHLPGIPSAAEVNSNGIDLGEMNAKLLQKIEELTLHAIDQSKKINKLEEIIIRNNLK